MVDEEALQEVTQHKRYAGLSEPSKQGAGSFVNFQPDQLIFGRLLPSSIGRRLPCQLSPSGAEPAAITMREPSRDEVVRNKDRLQSSRERKASHTVTRKYFLAALAKPSPVLLQATLNRAIVA
jgi:hypothetical protein